MMSEGVEFETGADEAAISRIDGNVIHEFTRLLWTDINSGFRIKFPETRN
jgi:hypothetical protein